CSGSANLRSTCSGSPSPPFFPGTSSWTGRCSRSNRNRRTSSFDQPSPATTAACSGENTSSVSPQCVIWWCSITGMVAGTGGRAADGRVGARAGAEEAGPAVDVEGAADRPVHDDERRRRVGGRRHAVQVERLVAHRLDGGEHDRQILWTAARHHRVHRDLLDGGAPVVGRDERDELVARPAAGLDGALDALAAAVSAARFALLGERHDHPEHHEFQAWLLRRMLESGRRPAVAFEMLDTTQAPALARHLATSPRDAAGLGDAVGWRASGWPEWRLYQPIAEIALAAGLPVVAANLPATAARAVARGDLAALDPALVRRHALDRAAPARPASRSWRSSMAGRRPRTTPRDSAPRACPSTTCGSPRAPTTRITARACASARARRATVLARRIEPRRARADPVRPLEQERG